MNSVFTEKKIQKTNSEMFWKKVVSAFEWKSLIQGDSMPVHIVATNQSAKSSSSLGKDHIGAILKQLSSIFGKTYIAGVESSV